MRRPPATLEPGSTEGTSPVTHRERYSELYAAGTATVAVLQPHELRSRQPKGTDLGLHAAPPTRLRSEASSIGGSRPCSKGRWMEYRRRALSSLLVAARV